jgi:PmbA protein
MDKGFLIKELMGVHMVDPVSGEFSLGASGMWVEKGKAVFPVIISGL